MINQQCSLSDGFDKTLIETKCFIWTITKWDLVHFHTHTHARMYTHAHAHTNTHTHTHTHTHTCWFLWFTGTLHRRNGFYTVQTVCAISPTPTLHLNLALTGDGAFLLFPQKNSLCMIYTRFKLWGHWKCPHKSPSPCNTYVIPMSLYKFVSS